MFVATLEIYQLESIDNEPLMKRLVTLSRVTQAHFDFPSSATSREGPCIPQIDTIKTGTYEGAELHRIDHKPLECMTALKGGSPRKYEVNQEDKEKMILRGDMHIF